MSTQNQPNSQYNGHIMGKKFLKESLFWLNQSKYIRVFFHRTSFEANRMLLYTVIQYNL